jgi:hypothetical protein
MFKTYQPWPRAASSGWLNAFTVIGPWCARRTCHTTGLGCGSKMAACSHPHGNSGGVLAGAAGTVEKAREGTPFSRALIREEEGGGSPPRPRRPLRSRPRRASVLTDGMGLFRVFRLSSLRL